MTPYMNEYGSPLGYNMDPPWGSRGRKSPHSRTTPMASNGRDGLIGGGTNAAGGPAPRCLYGAPLGNARDGNGLNKRNGSMGRTMNAGVNMVHRWVTPVHGNGVNQHTGFINRTTYAAGNAFGTMGTTPTGSHVAGRDNVPTCNETEIQSNPEGVA